MTRIGFGGWESGSTQAESMFGAGGTVQSTVKRSGTYALKCDSTAGNTTDTGLFEPWVLTLVTARSYFYRAYFRVESNLPTADAIIMRWPSVARIVLTTTGKLQLWTGFTGGSQVGSDSTLTVAVDTWYMLELKVRVDTGATDEVAARVDGTEFAAATGLSITDTAPDPGPETGWMSAPGANRVIYFDDHAFNDDQGAADNTWPGEGKCVLMVPTADAQRGSWTGGAGGTTNLWDALNNLPPTGTATETNTTQVENADSSPDNTTDEYRATMQTYTALGIGASDTVRLAQLWVWHGEDVAAGVKTGEAWIASNPAETQPADNINPFGPTASGALGTFPTNWRLTLGGAIDASGVTKGTAPVAHLRKTDTGTRVASACALWIYVEYEAAPAPTDRLPPYPIVVSDAVHRASRW